MLLDEKEHVLSINAAAMKHLRREGRLRGAGLPDGGSQPRDRAWPFSRPFRTATAKFAAIGAAECTSSIMSRIDSDGRVVGAVLLAFDITEQEYAERNRREFTANVSHELKTPLQGIMGSAELIEKGMVQAGGRAPLHRAHSHAKPPGW